MVGSKPLVTSLVSVLLLYRMSFFRCRAFRFAFSSHKSIWKRFEKITQFREVKCWLNVYLLVNANVSRVALEQECPTNRTLLNSVSKYILNSWRDLAAVSSFAFRIGFSGGLVNGFIIPGMTITCKLLNQTSTLFYIQTGRSVFHTKSIL